MDDSTLSRGSEGKPKVLRESEFYGGCIRVKISVKNTSSLVITAVALELESDERILHFDRCEPEYPQKNGKIILDSINPHTDRTIAFYLDPLICAKEGTDINCRVNFKYADGTPDTVNMEGLKIQVVCPIFRTEHDINIGRLKELIEELHSSDSKVYTIPKRVDISESLKICRNVIQQHDVRHIKTFKTTDDSTYECWYFGKTKVTKKDLVIKCAIRKDTESIEIFVSGNDPKDITGLLAEVGRNLTKEFDKIGKVQPVFNVVVKNSMVKGSNLLSFCDLDGVCGGNVVIEDSFVEGTNVASRNREGKEKARIEEQKKLDEVREKEKQHEADRLRKTEDALREKEQQLRQMEKAARKQQEKDDKRAQIEQGGKSSGVKLFYAVIILFGVLALGWYVTQDSNNPTIFTPQKTIPSVTTTPIMTEKVATSAAAVVTPSADQKSYTNSIGMEFVQIPAGEFDMGSLLSEAVMDDKESPVHGVKISKAFFMGKYEVTQKQWRDVMGTNPSYFKGDNLPVEQVSWNDAQEFIEKLNDKEGGNKYRLPSESEWEYVALAGTSTSYSFGNDESKLDDYAWYAENSGSRPPKKGSDSIYDLDDFLHKWDGKTHDIGQKNPNLWGLYDMHGNVWEWVQDNRHINYSGAPTDGSSWDSGGTGDGSSRVMRGGGWRVPAGYTRSAFRSATGHSGGGYDLGFRLVMDSPASTNANDTLKSMSLATPKVTQMNSIPVITPDADQTSFTNSLSIEFVLIPAGEFDMGSPLSEAGRDYNEDTIHRVKISNQFYIGKFEVTQKQWREVMGTNPSHFKGDNLPVESVSWNDVQGFIKKLNEMEGINKYRLPSEAEWEYAARAGTKTRYFFGDDTSKIEEYAWWYIGKSGFMTNPIGQKKPNPWGLYDIQGNVWEWVQDKYHENYNGAPSDGSAWEVDGSNPFRMYRGGCWSGHDYSCRSAYRLDSNLNPQSENLGFRLVRDL